VTAICIDLLPHLRAEGVAVLCQPPLLEHCSGAGCRPAATHFLCFAKESKQRKANPAARDPALRYGQPALEHFGRGPRKLASLKQRAALIRPKRSNAGAVRRVEPGVPDFRTPKLRTPHSLNRRSQSTSTRHGAYLSGSDLVLVFGLRLPPYGGAEQRSGARKKRDACLSEASLRTARVQRAAQVAPERSAGVADSGGRLFFAYFLLAKQKKVGRRRATPGSETQLERCRTAKSRNALTPALCHRDREQGRTAVLSSGESEQGRAHAP